MDAEKLKEIAKNADEAVKTLSQDLRQSAFEIILKKMLETNIVPSKPHKQKESKAKPKPQNSTNKESNKSDPVTTDLLTKINRTVYPLLSKMTTTGDKSLYLLKISFDHGVDGLVPSQIAFLLTEKFRQKVTQNAVSMALMDSSYVDRRPINIQGGAGYCYHLMDPGEKYIENLVSQLGSDKQNNNGIGGEK